MISVVASLSFNFIGDGTSTSLTVDIGTQLSPESLPTGMPSAIGFLNVSGGGSNPAVTITSSSLNKNLLTINFSPAPGSNLAVGTYSISGALLY